MVTLPGTRSASPGGRGPGTGQLSGPSPPGDSPAQGPTFPFTKYPAPLRRLGPLADHPTRLLRRIQSSAGWDNLCTPGPTAYLWYTRLRTPGENGLCAPILDCRGWGGVAPRPQEQQNPVGQGAGGGRGAGGRGGEGARGPGGGRGAAGALRGGAEQTGLLRGGASVEERGTQLPHPHLRSSRPCPAASALPVGLGGLGWRPDLRRPGRLRANPHRPSGPRAALGSHLGQ